jgi:biotin carboxyl carrier protein
MILQYNNNKYKVEANRSEDSRFQNYDVKINGEIKFTSVTKSSNNSYMIFNEENIREVFAAKDDKHIYVMIDSFQYIFDLKPDEILFTDGDKINDDKHDFITSPMPGSIVSVLVNENDIVESGAPVIIIEAMKMETKLYSSIAGRINKINCKPGQQVDSDFVLMEIVKE